MEKYGFNKLSTGDLLRQESTKSTSESLKLRKILDAGKLVDDDIMLNLIKNQLEQSQVKTIIPHTIFDGFPRTVNQAIGLDNLLEIIGQNLIGVFSLIIDQKLLLDRITGRLTCSQCGMGFHRLNMPPKKKGICDNCGSTKLEHRKDDEAETLSKRLKIYNTETALLNEFYSKKGLFKEIDGSLSPEIVAKQLDKYILSTENGPSINIEI